MFGRPGGLVAAGSVVVFVALLVAFWVPRTPNIGPDTLVLENGAKTALSCVHAHRFVNCGQSQEERSQAPYPLISAVGPFVILQYPAAMALLQLGLTDHQVYRGLSLLSIAAFVATLALLAYLPFGAGRPVVVLVLLSSPFLYYAYTTFGEMLAACFLVAFVLTVVRPSHWLLIAVAAWLAGLTKETAPPFVFALGLIALLGTGQSVRPSRARAVALLFGTLAALATNALFNVFRYGTTTNQEYLHGYGGHIPYVPIGQRINQFFALLVSPNGGIAFFWPAASALLALGCAYGFAAMGERPRNRSWWAAAGITAIFLALTIGLASWFAPFGWFAWGPRLTLPWIPTFVLLVVATYDERLRSALRWITRSTSSTLAASLLVAIVTLPQIGVLTAPGVDYELFKPDQACPNPTHAHATAMFVCHNHWAWTKHPVLLDALHGFRSHWGLLLAATFTITAFSLLRQAGSQSRSAATDNPAGIHEYADDDD